MTIDYTFDEGFDFFYEKPVFYGTERFFAAAGARFYRVAYVNDSPETYQVSRIDADGSEDATFFPVEFGFAPSFCVELSDGVIALVGQTDIAVLHGDPDVPTVYTGTPPTSPNMTGVVKMDNGKFLVKQSISPGDRFRFHKYDSLAAQDLAWTPTTIYGYSGGNGPATEMLSGGKVLVTGTVLQSNVGAKRVALRLNEDGTHDATYTAVEGSMAYAVFDSLGGFYARDVFDTYAVQRIAPDGTLDTDFAPPNGEDDTALWAIPLFIESDDALVLSDDQSGWTMYRMDGATGATLSPPASEPLEVPGGGSPSYGRTFLHGQGEAGDWYIVIADQEPDYVLGQRYAVGGDPPDPGVECFWTDLLSVTEDCGGGPGPEPEGPVAFYAGAGEGRVLLSTTWGVYGQYIYPLVVDGSDFLPDSDRNHGLMFYGPASGGAWTFGPSAVIEWTDSDTEEDMAEVVNIEDRVGSKYLLASGAGDLTTLNDAYFMAPALEFTEDVGPFTVEMAGGTLTFVWNDYHNGYIVGSQGELNVGDYLDVVADATFNHSATGDVPIVWAAWET